MLVVTRRLMTDLRDKPEDYGVEGCTLPDLSEILLFRHGRGHGTDSILAEFGATGGRSNARQAGGIVHFWARTARLQRPADARRHCGGGGRDHGGGFLPRTYRTA